MSGAGIPLADLAARISETQHATKVALDGFIELGLVELVDGGYRLTALGRPYGAAALAGLVAVRGDEVAEVRRIKKADDSATKGTVKTADRATRRPAA